MVQFFFVWVFFARMSAVHQKVTPEIVLTLINYKNNMAAHQFHSRKLYDRVTSTTRVGFDLVLRGGEQCLTSLAIANEPVRGVCVIGPRGSAKSFLGCCLLKDALAFEHVPLGVRVQHAQQVITHGADICTQPPSFNDLSARWGLAARIAPNTPRVVFFDVEGLGQLSMCNTVLLFLTKLFRC
jgi:hypothetical protein